jgi:hypothetical protein
VADDIVTRLQSGKHSQDPCPKCGDDTFCCTYELCDCCCAALEATAEAADEIKRLRTAGDSLAAATRTLVDTYMTEQSALYGHIAIDPDVLRALAEWGEVRG